MPVTAADLDVLQSANGSSDGGAESATEIVSGVAENLWPNLSDALRAAGGTRIKKFYIKNNSLTEFASNPSVWIAQSPTGMTVVLGLGASSADDATNTQGNMTAFSGSALVSLTSSGGDTRAATVTGLDGGGLPQTEAVTLNGTSEVLSAHTYSVVYNVVMSAVHATNVVTVKQGSGGTVRGTIGATLLVCWLWVSASTKAAGIEVPSVLAGSSVALWCQQSWDPGISAQRPTQQIVALQENS